MSRKTKVTATVENADTSPLKAAIDAAIASDITSNLKAKQSGAEVATAFDTALPGIGWYNFKGNASAANCGMEIILPL